MMNETGRNRRVLRCPECVVADQIAPDVDLRRDLRIGFVGIAFVPADPSNSAAQLLSGAVYWLPKLAALCGRLPGSSFSRGGTNRPMSQRLLIPFLRRAHRNDCPGVSTYLCVRAGP
jgi:hypothetical protein